MAIVEMKRLRVISPSAETDRLLRDLTSLGCVELNKPVANPDFAGLALPERSLFAGKPEVTES